MADANVQLERAIREGNFAEIKAAVNAGADPNNTTTFYGGVTPLGWYLAHAGWAPGRGVRFPPVRDDIIIFLLKSGAKLRPEDVARLPANLRGLEKSVQRLPLMALRQKFMEEPEGGRRRKTRGRKRKHRKTKRRI